MTQRGRVQLLIDNFKFCSVEELKSGEKRWRCRPAWCKANAYTVGPQYDISRSNLTHNHAPLANQQIVRQVLSTTGKRKATEDLCRCLSKIVRQMLATVDTHDLTTTDIRYAKKTWPMREEIASTTSKKPIRSSCKATIIQRYYEPYPSKTDLIYAHI